MIIITHLLYCEIPYLDEWINFHRQQGFKHFYIYVKYGKLTFGHFVAKNDNIFSNLINKYV